jgi:S-adenosylmethionine:tRNA ribosyltransferase-isomerase
LPDLLEPPDCVVLNDSRVLPARLIGHRMQTGGRWEGLFLRTLMNGQWELLCETRGNPRAGESFSIDGHDLTLVLRDRSGGIWRMEPQPHVPASDFLLAHGHVPLPPYIRGAADEPADRERYQTVYAAHLGAVAAPTAGLHFTTRLLNTLAGRGITIVRLTLHVGIGTFLPVRDSIESHKMHEEWGELRRDVVDAITRCRAAGGRVVAVGTTSVRVLETAVQSGTLEPWCGETSLFIRAPYRFRAVDALITNFHLPRTTLLALVQAFAGRELTRAAYAEAIRERYRFYSFGDAMLIV